jgi:peptidoglycan/LPS O-acetylase OafA/YrhL
MTERPDRPRPSIAALAIPIGVLMLLVWTVSILTIETPGWMHLLLTLGVFLVIWGVVRRGTPPPAR